MLYDDIIGGPSNPTVRGIGVLGGFNFQALNAPDTRTTAEDTTLTVNAANGVLANDDNTSGSLAVQTFTIAGVTGTFNAGQTASIPGVGTLQLNANGSYVFTPAANYSGTVPTVTYTTIDGTANETSTLNITVTPVNDAPVDGNETNSTNEDTTLTVADGAAGDLLNNTTDIDGGVAIITGFTVPGLTGTQSVGTPHLIPGVGTITINANGSYSFAPVANYNGTVPTITYTVSDQAGGTDTSTLVITVNPVNDAPVDGNETNSTNEDTTLTVADGAAGDLLNNTTDIDGGVAIITGFTVPGLTGTQSVGTPHLIPGVGTITINANGSYSFAPVANYNGTVPTITYTVSDQAGGTDTSTLVITVNPVNDAPVAQDDAETTDQNTVVSDNVLFDNGNGVDSDIDGDTLTVSQVNGASYTPGTPVGLTSGAEVTMQPTGFYTYNPNGQFDYLPAGVTATDTFTYQISDGNGGFDTATVTITITGTNDAPAISGDVSGAVTEDDASTLTTSGALTISDPDTGEAVFNAGTVNGSYGDLTIDAAGNWSYAADNTQSIIQTLAVGATLTETLTVTSADGTTQDITIIINGVNDAPTATDNSGSVTEDTNLSDSGNMLTDNDGSGVDGDVDIGDSLSVVSVDGVAAATGSVAGTYGSLAFDGTGAYTYNLTNANPAVQALGAGETLTETFDYIVSDGNGGSDTATLTITINGQNDDPTGFDATMAYDMLQLCAAYGGVVRVTEGSVVAEFTNVLDVDASDLHTFRIVDGTGTPVVDPDFEIVGNQLVIKATNTLVDGVQTPRSVIVQVDDGNGGTFERMLDFNLNSYTGTFTGGAGRDMAVGTSGNDVMNGGGNVDYLFGGDGNDTLNGGSGYDVLEGGTGADVLNGGTSGDTASYRYANAAVTADLANSAANTGDAAGDTYISIENLHGSSFSDVLSGDAGDNWIYGLDGDDVINGRGGNDTLFGGAGNNLFIFANGSGNDRIAGFVAGAGTDDVLDISDFGFADFAAVQAAASIGPDGCVILQLDADDSVELHGVSSVASLSIDDFIT